MNIDVEINNNELYKQTFHQAFIAMTLTNEAGNFIEVNETFCNMLGYTKEELQALSFQNVTHPDDLTKNLTLLSKLKNWQITSYQIEKRYICKSGEIIWALTNVARVKGSTMIIAQIQDISKQKEKERKLEEKEANYHLMVEYSTDLIMRHYPNGKAFSVSPSSKEVLGYEPHELIGVSPYDKTWIHPDDLPRMIKSHKQISCSATLKIRYRIRAKTGCYIWIESTAKAIFNKTTNQLEEIITVTRECTDHVKNEFELNTAKLKLEKSNQHINNILDSITDGFLALDYNGNIIYLNSKIEQDMNMNRCELIGEKAWNQFPFFKGTKFETDFLETIRKQVPTQFEEFFEELNVWLEIRLYPRNEIVSVYFTDITERKKIEQELKESEERYRNIVELSKDGIGIHNIEGKFLFTNPAFLKQVGATENKEVLGQHVHNILAPEDHKKFDEKMNEYRKQKMINNRLSKFTIKSLDGTFRDVEVTDDKVIYNGQPAIQFIARDITEQKKYQEFLHKADKLNLVGELAAGFAHEIRNPLTTIKGFIQLFQSTHSGNGKYFKIINKEFVRLETVISEFLTLAKPHHEITYKIENMCQILKEVIVLENANAILKNIQLNLKCDQDTMLFYCDKNSFKQAFINILQNAIEATSEKGKIEISIKKKNNNSFEIKCKDNGCGIPKHLIHRLGEPFYTLKEKGTGLGLMICYKIIENHNGTILIDSEEGKGTTVSIQLPILSD